MSSWDQEIKKYPTNCQNNTKKLKRRADPYTPIKDSNKTVSNNRNIRTQQNHNPPFNQHSIQLLSFQKSATYIFFLIFQMAGGGFLLHWGPTGGEIYQAMGALSRPSVYSDDLEKKLQEYYSIRLPSHGGGHGIWARIFWSLGAQCECEGDGNGNIKAGCGGWWRCCYHYHHLAFCLLEEGTAACQNHLGGRLPQTPHVQRTHELGSQEKWNICFISWCKLCFIFFGRAHFMSSLHVGCLRRPPSGIVFASSSAFFK